LNVNSVLTRPPSNSKRKLITRADQLVCSVGPESLLELLHLICQTVAETPIAPAWPAPADVRLDQNDPFRLNPISELNRGPHPGVSASDDHNLTVSRANQGRAATNFGKACVSKPPTV